MKITILYFSITCNTEKMAHYIEDGIKSVEKFEVKMMNINNYENIDREFIHDSRAIIFGTPTYCANICWQFKKWFDQEWDLDLSGKIGAVFATANCIHGGADVALLGMLNHILVKGMLAYSSGAGCGRPFIHLGPIAIKDELEEKKDLFVLFGKRIAEKTSELFKS
ncbi:MAG: flavodoxin family protein [Eubacteriaceae bacterium]